MSEFISGNPYRVLGVSSDSGQKDIQKNLSKMKAYAKLGRSIDFDFDLPQLNFQEVDRNQEIVSKIESKILLDLNKVKYALFWYQKVTPFDSVALDHLKNGHIEKSLEIFQKAVKSDEINHKNISTQNNLSTLLIHSALDDSKTDVFKRDNDSIELISKAIGKKLDIIDSDYFDQFCSSLNVVSDIDKSSIRTAISKVFLKRLVKNYSRDQLRNLISSLDERVSEVFSNELVKAPVANIKLEVKKTSDKLDDNPSDGIQLGKNLIKNCVADLKELEGLLGKSHYLYEELADKISNEIMQCGIGYFNEVGDHKEFLSAYKYALSIACTEKTISRAKDCIKHCEDTISADICGLCNTNPIGSSCIRIQMYKMTGYNTYSYFKNGGLKIDFCPSCYNEVNNELTKAQILTGLIYALVNVILLAMELPPFVLIADIVSAFWGAPFFWILKWLYSQLNQKYYNLLDKHKLIITTKREGYRYGKPNS